MSTSIGGGCLCGAVRYECTAEPGMMGHCQCVDCRKTSASGHRSHAFVAGEAVEITGEVKIYERPADSGNVVGRAFCPACGSPIYSINTGMPGAIVLSASSLDDPEIFRPQMVVYASRGPSWDVLDENLPTFEEMPPNAPGS